MCYGCRCLMTDLFNLAVLSLFLAIHIHIHHFPHTVPQQTCRLWLVTLAGKQKCWSSMATAWGEEAPVGALPEPRQTNLLNCMVLIYRGSDVSHGGNRSSPFAWVSHWSLWPGQFSASQCIISRRTSGSPLNWHLILCLCINQQCVKCFFPI